MPQGLFRLVAAGPGGAQSERAHHCADQKPDRGADLDQFDDGPAERAKRQTQHRRHDLGDKKPGANNLNRQDKREDKPVIQFKSSKA